MRDTEKEYFDTYNKLAVDKSVFSEKWQAGDYWMTASEAKEAGFITNVKEKVQIDRGTAMMIAACGGIEVEEVKELKERDMDVRMIARSLGMDESSSEEQVKARLEEHRRQSEELSRMKAESEAREKREKVEKIKAALDKAVLEKRIIAQSRPTWETLLNENFDSANAALEAISPVVSLSKQIGGAPGSGTQTHTHQGKTFEELQENDPGALDELQDMGHYGGYTEADFEKLLQVLSQVKGKFMMSSYPSDLHSRYTKQYGWNH